MLQKIRIGILIMAFAAVPTIAQSEGAAEMRDSMPTEYAGDPDVEFMRSMIAHHQGAIAIAEVELKYGKDAQARTFAENIIRAQKAEIEQLSEWLKQQGQ